MKIVSFNVNGLRAVLRKSFREDFARIDADIFVVEETKLSDPSPAGFPFRPEGYQAYWTVSDVKKGYSGVAVFAKKAPLGVTYGLTGGKYDEEGRIVTLEYDSFYLIGCYTPNSGEELKRLGFRMGFEDDLLSYMKTLDAGKPVILTGDLNVAHEEIDIRNPKSNVHNAGFTPEERGKFTRLLSAGFADVFRRLYPDRIAYSWWSYRFNARENNAGWRIDYFVVSERLMPKVRDSKILGDVFGSDHCPVELDINLL